MMSVKIELKAYKCVFPKLYTEAYNQYMWQDSKQYEVIFAKTQKEAVKNRCQYDDNFLYWELKQNINTRRFPEKDLYSQEKCDSLKKLTHNMINHLTHSLGVEVGEICPKSFYRNYSMYYVKNTECETLVELGLMENWQKLDSEVYGLTEKGIEAVKTLLLTTKENINKKTDILC